MKSLAEPRLHDDIPALAAPAFSPGYMLTTLALTLIWGALINQFGESPIYWVMGPYSLAVCVTLLVVRGAALRARLRPTLKNAALGLGMGV
ncbi:MAG TPA: hypothetical protein VI299_26785, partial [Polyangiales bacterium]